MNTISPIGLREKSAYNEAVFLNEMETALGSNYSLTKTKNPLCNVDFVVRRDNKVIGYMELKVRKRLDNYETLMLGYTKLNRIELKYRQTIIVWYCVYTKTTWFCKYNEDLLHSECDDLKSVYYISKKKCRVGLADLIALCHIRRW